MTKKDKMMRYEKPELKTLLDSSLAVGACSGGSSETVDCQGGGLATVTCGGGSNKV